MLFVIWLRSKFIFMIHCLSLYFNRITTHIFTWNIHFYMFYEFVRICIYTNTILFTNIFVTFDPIIANWICISYHPFIKCSSALPARLHLILSHILNNSHRERKYDEAKERKLIQKVYDRALVTAATVNIHYVKRCMVAVMCDIAATHASCIKNVHFR